MGPDGPLYDTRSPEWRMSGGNIFVYQELMEAKMEREQEKYMLKQMHQAAKQQKAQSKAKPKSQGPAGASNFPTPSGAGIGDPFAAPVNHYHRKKYKHTPSPPASSKPGKSKTAQSNTTP
jgi:hypothetical protein